MGGVKALDLFTTLYIIFYVPCQTRGGGEGLCGDAKVVPQDVQRRSHLRPVQVLLPRHQHRPAPLRHGLQVYSRGIEFHISYYSIHSYSRTLDRDSSGTIGFVELMLALELVGANKYLWNLCLDYGNHDKFNFSGFKMRLLGLSRCLM